MARDDKRNDYQPVMGTRRDLYEAEDQRRAVLRYLTPNVIDPNPNQPRRIIDRDSLEELKRSIAERGILQPLLAVKGLEGHVTLVAGQRRLIAARELGMLLVPVMVLDHRPGLTFDALIENVQREPLDPLDEGEAFHRLAAEQNFSHAEIGARIGKSKQYVTDRVRLISRLSPLARDLLSTINVDNMNARAFDSEIPHEESAQNIARARFSIARALSFLPLEKQAEALETLKREMDQRGRRLTTREVEERLAHFKDGARPAPVRTPIPKAEPKRRPRKSGKISVDGRDLESFKALAELAQLPPDRSLNLDLEATIRMLEADLTRLRQLREGQN